MSEVSQQAELYGESIDISRRYLKAANVNHMFFDNAVHHAVVELMELRRRFTNGRRLDLSEAADLWTPDEALCADCGMHRLHHGEAFSVNDCDSYRVIQPPSDDEARD